MSLKKIIQSIILGWPLTLYAADQPNVVDKHVLFIGIDGCRDDAFNVVYQQIKAELRYPDFLNFMQNSLIDRHLYAGGHLYDSTQQLTVSAPGWTTILTGVWAEQHHIYTNTDLDNNQYNHQYPTIFNLIKKFIPNATTASFTDWSPLAVLAGYSFYGHDAADTNRTYSYHNLQELDVQDQQLTQDVIQTIQSESPPTFTFIHYGNPDDAGHLYGFSKDSMPYLMAIDSDIARINAILQAIHQSEIAGKQWLIILTTDHGGHQHIHGLPSWDDRDVFTVIHAAQDNRYNHFSHTLATQGQTTFLPTIFAYLNLPSAAFSALPGKIINQPSRHYLHFDYDLTAMTPDNTAQPLRYEWSGLKPYLNNILSITYASNESYYVFLKNGAFLRYNHATQQIDEKLTAIDNAWPGLGRYTHHIISIVYGVDAADVKPKYVVFLNNGKYLSYDLARNLRLKKPASIHKDWPGLDPYLRYIQSVSYLGQQNYLFKLSNNTYIVYNITQHKITQKPTSITTIFPGLLGYAKKILISFYGMSYHGDQAQEKYYFFLQPIIYH